MALHSAIKGKLISVIGDEDTCVGFLLGGVGEINKNRHPNFMVVDKRVLLSVARSIYVGTGWIGILNNNVT
ncbi:V-type proton ATPase subunit F 1 isoform X2 [Drosophila virilis]|uniref:V-type proton ATPase subunit F 1 isoform X2 n=1 Tax=Drosophila virilis TaxID=7244 RepID=UPI001395CC9B|nr:V-type proton ATPase subunit F 1 isoform X2 [Drosophila virilis]